MTQRLAKSIICVVFAMVCLIIAPVLARAQELWFSPPDDNSAHGARWTVPDFSMLFSPDAPWAPSASGLRVLLVSNYYATTVSAEQLRRIEAYLNAHHIGLAIASGAMLADADCGTRVEGINHRVADMSVRHLKKLGADLKWVVLDAPMNGHDYHGPRACNYSIQETVRRMKTSIADIRRMYPDVKIGWTQVPDRVDRSFEGWVSELKEEIAAFRQVAGTPLDALMLDMNYNLPGWQQYLRASTAILHENGMRVGAFLDAAGGRGVTDDSWMTAARTHIRDVVAGRFPLDYIIVASWQHHPQRLLPESDPMALTSLLGYYHRLITEEVRR